MRYRIQSLVWPSEEKHQKSRELFYRGEAEELVGDGLRLKTGQKVNLTTYINACSWQKWQTYTKAKSLRLHLDIDGVAQIRPIGWSLGENGKIEEREFAKCKTEAGKSFLYDFPENEEQMVGFEIEALAKDIVLKGGYYTVEIDKKELNPVRLSIATTTYKKEDFIEKNVTLLEKMLLDTTTEGMAEEVKNIYLHIVDNGRSLKPKKFQHERIWLHPSDNVGGAGGFTRGMIESMRQKPRATHVLLMDDDILVLPESIWRTYSLLRLQREEYRESFVSGAMLSYNEPYLQLEDVGRLNVDATITSMKGVLNHKLPEDNLRNEQKYDLGQGCYAAWWYCCIPVEMIEKNGLPLPIFVRGDDIEYGLRCKPKFITMNGICVWHISSEGKFNAPFDRYQYQRNLAIGRAVTGVNPDADIVSVMAEIFRTEMLRFNYKSAELILRALEDFLRGPEYLEQPNGDKILAENTTLKHELRPYAEIDEAEEMAKRLVEKRKPLGRRGRAFLKVTWNGQRWWPKSWARRGVAPTRYDWDFDATPIVGYRDLIAINPYEKTAVIYKRDKERFKKLYKRYRKAMRTYYKDGEQIRTKYAAAREKLTSEEFWQEYLKLDK